jgi:hypothetical protein
MKTLLSVVTVMATALALAATGLAIGEAKNESPFTESLNVLQFQSSKALVDRSEAVNRLYHLGVYAATAPAPNYQAVPTSPTYIYEGGRWLRKLD